MTTPGRAVKMVMRQRVAARSIWIFGTEADSSFFFRISRIRRSSASSLPNSFFSAYHFERQSLLAGIHSPIGVVFCPMVRIGEMESERDGGMEGWRDEQSACRSPTLQHSNTPLLRFSSCYSSDKTIFTWQLRFKIGPAEPRALGVTRLIVVAVCARASLMRSTSGFSPLLFSALAMADFNVLATNRADLRGTTARTACACTAFMP